MPIPPADPVFLSYCTYYVVPMLWGLYLRRFAAPAVLLLVVWHFMIYEAGVGMVRASTLDFRIFMPLTAFFGLGMGYMLSNLLNLKRLLFLRQFDRYGGWLFMAVIQFVLMHAIRVVWEERGTFEPPSNYAVTILLEVLLIILWYFVGRGFTIWAYEDPRTNKLAFDDKAALKFHLAWGGYQISADVIFAVFQWSSSTIWPFWAVLTTFIFHVLMWFAIDLFYITDRGDVYYKAGREKATKVIEDAIPIQSALMDWSMGAEQQHQQHGAAAAAAVRPGDMEMSLLIPPAAPPRPPQQMPGTSSSVVPSNNSMAGYSAGGTGRRDVNTGRVSTNPLG